MAESHCNPFSSAAVPALSACMRNSFGGLMAKPRSLTYWNSVEWNAENEPCRPFGADAGPPLGATARQFRSPFAALGVTGSKSQSAARVSLPSSAAPPMPSVMAAHTGGTETQTMQDCGGGND